MILTRRASIVRGQTGLPESACTPSTLRERAYQEKFHASAYTFFHAHRLSYECTTLHHC
jgi:hypothetical protein